MTRTRLLQTLIILLIVALLPLQALALPLMAGEAAAEAPEFAHLRWPLLALAEFMLLVADVLAAALLKLVALAARDQVFSRPALVWVNLLIAALWTETAAVLPWLFVLGAVTHGPPGAGVICLLALVAGAAAALTVAVLRSLLLKATAQREELAEVI
ncbi:MAG: DUF2975 domain-containing protein [Bifidobacteriaceae bacterium]|jgi:hypothetical protein|nr:DUF2975 domain-containing protein [Bifidobacteriaceae bacterium]